MERHILAIVASLDAMSASAQTSPVGLWQAIDVGTRRP